MHNVCSYACVRACVYFFIFFVLFGVWSCLSCPNYDNTHMFSPAATVVLSNYKHVCTARFTGALPSSMILLWVLPIWSITVAWTRKRRWDVVFIFLVNRCVYFSESVFALGGQHSVVINGLMHIAHEPNLWSIHAILLHMRKTNHKQTYRNTHGEFCFATHLNLCLGSSVICFTDVPSTHNEQPCSLPPPFFVSIFVNMLFCFCFFRELNSWLESVGHGPHVSDRLHRRRGRWIYRGREYGRGSGNSGRKKTKILQGRQHEGHSGAAVWRFAGVGFHYQPHGESLIIFTTICYRMIHTHIVLRRRGGKRGWRAGRGVTFTVATDSTMSHFFCKQYLVWCLSFFACIFSQIPGVH